MDVRNLAMHRLRQIRDGEVVCQQQGRGMSLQHGLLDLDEMVIAQSKRLEPCTEFLQAHHPSAMHSAAK